MQIRIGSKTYFFTFDRTNPAKWFRRTRGGVSIAFDPYFGLEGMPQSARMLEAEQAQKTKEFRKATEAAFTYQIDHPGAKVAICVPAPDRELSPWVSLVKPDGRVGEIVWMAGHWLATNKEE